MVQLREKNKKVFRGTRAEYRSHTLKLQKLNSAFFADFITAGDQGMPRHSAEKSPLYDPRLALTEYF